MTKRPDELARQSDGDPVALSDEQRAALDRSFHSPVSVITGTAGTGKSTLLAPLIAAISKHGGMQPNPGANADGQSSRPIEGDRRRCRDYP